MTDEWLRKRVLVNDFLPGHVSGVGFWSSAKDVSPDATMANKDNIQHVG
jgi:hypothetical protein